MLMGSIGLYTNLIDPYYSTIFLLIGVIGALSGCCLLYCDCRTHDIHDINPTENQHHSVAADTYAQTQATLTASQENSTHSAPQPRTAWDSKDEELAIDYFKYGGAGRPTPKAINIFIKPVIFLIDLFSIQNF